MAELSDILRLWQQQKQSGNPLLLATVVKTAGSSYRLPGARLLITRGGQKAGSVSGGCLEEDLVRKSWWLTENGPVIRRYDTTPEGEIGSGYGLGCNGVIHVLLERLPPISQPAPGEGGPLEWIAQVRATRKPAAICHFLGQGAAGQRLAVRSDGSVWHNIADPSLPDRARQMTAESLLSGVPRHDSLGANEVFVETLAPPVRLLIFGAGDDAIPLTQLAAFLGWQARVFDGRAHYVRPEKFPDAENTSLRPLGAALPVLVDRWTVAVLMTHSYSQDLDALRKLAADPPRYVGILGPRKRTDTLLAEAGLDAQVFGGSLFGPTGLDIAADGAHQVALAVTAEIQAVLNGRSGGHLRDAQSSIHADSQAESTPPWVTGPVCA